MSKNLILVQNGNPSKTDGAVVESLNIKNFFRFEKSIAATTACNVIYDDVHKNVLFTKQYYENTGTLKENNSFKHYSFTPIMFAIRMKKGSSASNILITSRLTTSNLRLRFLDIGDSLQDFKDIYTNINKGYYVGNGQGYNWYNTQPLIKTHTAISIPLLHNINHCFMAFLISDNAYQLNSGATLLNNEPLMNISWTETVYNEIEQE